MKKILALLLVALLVASMFVGCVKQGEDVEGGVEVEEEVVEQAKDEEPEDEPKELEAMTFKDGTYEGTGKGFAGDLAVKVVVEGEKITSIDVLDNSETPGISDPAIKGIPEAIIAAQNIDVDNVSGASGTSKGIKEAVKNALDSEPAAAEVAKEEPKKEEPKKEEPKKEEPKADGYKDGTYEGTGKGFAGDLKVKVTISGGKIASVEVGENGETPGISDPAKNTLPGAIVSAQSADVDVAAGATGTSNGIKAAVKDALSKAK